MAVCHTTQCGKGEEVHGEDSMIKKILKGDVDGAPPAQATCRFSCPECKLRCYHRSALITHLKTNHEIQVLCETKDFGTWTEFLSWKEAEEAQNYCHFVKPTGVKSRCGGM
jgi:hypothetical protein